MNKIFSFTVLSSLFLNMNVISAISEQCCTVIPQKISKSETHEELNQQELILYEKALLP